MVAASVGLALTAALFNTPGGILPVTGISLRGMNCSGKILTDSLARGTNKTGRLGEAARHLEESQNRG